jgi:hypothetical protein
MNVPKPPVIGILLLTWMGPDDPALIGDLVEGYRSGRSRLWFLRQVLAAILIGAMSTVRSHKLVVGRAVVVGWVVGWVYFQYLALWVHSAVYAAINFDDFLFVAGVTRWFYLNQIGFPDGLLTLALPVTVCLGWFVNGWIVGRLHRTYGASIVIVYVGVFTIMWILQLSWLILLRSTPSSTILALGTNAFLNGSVPVLAGGLWGARRLRLRLTS